MRLFDRPVVVRGGGDLGSGVALRLHRAGFPVVVLETQQPLVVRRTVAFAEAVYQGTAGVEEMEGRLTTPGELFDSDLETVIPVVVDGEAETLARLQPVAVVDAIMAKRNVGTHRAMAPITVALGPGFVAGIDVDAVIETNRGADLGRVIWRGSASANTGTPGEVSGRGADRVLRAPADGTLRAYARIGDIVGAGDVLAEVAGQQVQAPFRGMVRGLARDGLPVRRGLKVGDLDPRLDPALCTRVSDKALAVAGGVLEAVLHRMAESREDARVV